METEFKVLGPLEVRHRGEPVAVPAGGARVLLSALLLHHNRVVPADDLVDLLWENGPPNLARARSSLHMAVLRLRRSLGPADVVGTASGGYVAEIDPDALDLHRFRELIAAGRFGEALDLWRGEPLSDVRSDTLHRDHVAPLAEERLAALERRVDADLAAGRDADLLAELRALTGRHPLRERFWAQLVHALHGSDRRAEALAAYAEVRELLAEELGADPGPSLREAHRVVIADGEPDVVVPHQIPAHPAHFVGRDDELDRLTALLDRSAGAAVISAVRGTGGIGKTALALRWAERVADRFPDGRLYVNLRGFDPANAPLDVGEALRGFLEALGVKAERVPTRPADQAALYRSKLAGRKVLVVLDNARDADQVLPLLPGGTSCFVLVTSRNQLGELVRVGAVPLTLDVMPDVEARRLVERVVGVSRTGQEPAAVRRLVELCGGLPLALATVSARAALNPGFRLASLADELADEWGRMAGLDAGDEQGVRAVLSWSYRALSARAARMFRLLDVHPGPVISVPSAASLAAVPTAEAAAALAELARLHLLTEVAPGRFAFHDLLRAYAATEADADPPEERDAARARVLGFYLHSAFNAVKRIHPQRDTSPVRLEPLPPGAVAHEPADDPAAWRWIDLEYPVLLSTSTRAAETGHGLLSWHLCWTLGTVFDRRGQWHDWLAMLGEAERYAVREGDGRALATIKHHSSVALQMTGDPEAARAALEQGLVLFEGLGDRRGLGDAHRGMAFLCENAGDPRAALEHGQRALEHYKAVGFPFGVAGTMSAISLYHSHLGDYPKALEMGHRALEQQRALGHTYGEANVLDNIGWAHHRAGDHGEAVGYFRESADLFRKSGSVVLEAQVLVHLAEAEEALGDVGEARRALARVMGLAGSLQESFVADVEARLSRLDDTAPGGRPGSRAVAAT
ncbi:AfsR/SARP family transcriptional regulator [Saccharothrix hoggarensis]|uniref:BTAD domain-containing putative transcriptional regulator n=1 Tax=Saccharothrix hoggarensis TaxID=913853 RepID=A0ABW3R189_9PSEU